jgi:hypothetical protein
VFTSYLYDQTIDVQLLDEDPLLTTRYRTVYNRPIKIYQGIDNPLKIVVKNQDQKPVNMYGYSVQLDIQDPSIQNAVVSIACTWANANVGIATVTIDRNTVNALDQRIYKATLKRIETTTNQERPLFMDDNFTVQLDLEVQAGWYESSAQTPLPDFIIDGGEI